MEKPARYKSKNKKPPPKTAKKRKSEGPTCSMFLAEIARKLANKRKQEQEAPKNIIQTIIESLTNALPIKFTKKSPEANNSPVRIEHLQNIAPELVPNDLVEISPPPPNDVEEEEEHLIEVKRSGPVEKPVFKMPKMPLVSSEVLKVAAEKKKKSLMRDASVNTGNGQDITSELVKHVGTLKKISLIAEEFNVKTAKSLKEIVDSVQQDLINRLSEIREEQKLQEKALTIREDENEDQKENN